MQNPVRPVPQMRIREKVDECMARLDYAGVERILSYWLSEAQQGGDKRGELMIRSELTGHFRKTGDKQKAYEHGEASLNLVSSLGLQGSLSHATALINLATACTAFSDYEKGLAYFEQAKEICLASPSADPSLLGGLCNNMGLALTALSRYGEALDLYGQALEHMKQVPSGELEQAVTFLNMADTVKSRDGMEKGEAEICSYLDQAGSLLHTPSLPRDGYYAYICGRCAPVFDFYGYFMEAENLKNIAEKIHERS